MQLPLQRKRLHGKILSHIIIVLPQSLLVLVGKSKSVYTSLMIVKIDATTVNNS